MKLEIKKQTNDNKNKDIIFTDHLSFLVNTPDSISISFLLDFRNLNPGIRFWSISRDHSCIDIPECKGLGTRRHHDDEAFLHEYNLQEER